MYEPAQNYVQTKLFTKLNFKNSTQKGYFRLGKVSLCEVTAIFNKSRFELNGQSKLLSRGEKK